MIELASRQHAAGIMVSPYQSLPHALRQFEVRHCISLLGRAEVARREWPRIHQRPVHVGFPPEQGPLPELRVGVRSTFARLRSSTRP
jgi:hypothetical protein